MDNYQKYDHDLTKSHGGIRANISTLTESYPLHQHDHTELEIVVEGHRRREREVVVLAWLAVRRERRVRVAVERELSDLPGRSLQARLGDRIDRLGLGVREGDGSEEQQ